MEQLLQLEINSDRQEFLTRHPSLRRAAVVERLAPLVVKKIRVDAHEALRLAEALLLIARKVRDRQCEALALRGKANALYACGNNRGAVQHHDRAYKIYASQRNWKEAARTLSSSIQPLILSGDYDRAFAASQEARELFSRIGEHVRTASLENNVGNIFHRLDRFEEALAHYERAYEALEEYQEWEHAAVALSNMAMCLISLNDFPRALQCYQKARDLCVTYALPRLRDQADYNIAYLYYLRGEYNRAIEMLLATRRQCELSGDAYHVALCQLDLSDIYLELNLSEEARKAAHQGFLGFTKLGIGYEAAKTLANVAIAYGQQRSSKQALERLAQARRMFAKEKNTVWPWLLDLYQALILFHKEDYLTARQLCRGAAHFFDQTMLSGKAVLAHLLLARIALELDDLGVAAQQAHAALTRLSALQAPLLVYQAHLLIGHVATRQGAQSTAYAAYQKARLALETLRIRLLGEELKISFVKDRLEVYDSLLELYLSNPNGQITAGEAFEYMEAAKSRSMIETILQSGRSLQLSGEHSKDLQRVHDLRGELNWYYHRIELEQLRPERASGGRVSRLQQEVRTRESQLLQMLRELPAQERENVSFEAPEFSLSSLQAAIPSDATLVEYYSASERVLAAVVSRDRVEIRPVTQLTRVRQLLQALRFQLAKFSMGTEYTCHFQNPLLRTTESHLQDLYTELVAPLRESLSSKHLVFVPHGPMHFLPFHALRNGSEYLADAYTISYAPSATLFALCQQRSAASSKRSLILGIPDKRAPHIDTEARSVAALLPQAELYLGEAASGRLLREEGEDAEFLHIATHGIYRQDNPMFSAIRLGDSYLNLYDLYQLRLKTRLVTLSGCATGMNVIAAGDELLGLQRGLFYAGATSLLLSLWDVHDRSTAELMQEFYRTYAQTGDMAGALQSAMRSLRQQNPHPYFWAPFVLIGKVERPITARSAS
ncbi:MAG TPA: CHAT domain-containing protein [Terriglobales bacterium]|nr:CHAT domain-containing protein [Terriglobales bacterium]